MVTVSDMAISMGMVTPMEQLIMAAIIMGKSGKNDKGHGYYTEE